MPNPDFKASPETASSELFDALVASVNKRRYRSGGEGPAALRYVVVMQKEKASNARTEPPAN